MWARYYCKKTDSLDELDRPSIVRFFFGKKLHPERSHSDFVTKEVPFQVRSYLRSPLIFRHIGKLGTEKEQSVKRLVYNATATHLNTTRIISLSKRLERTFREDTTREAVTTLKESLFDSRIMMRAARQSVIVLAAILACALLVLAGGVDGFRQQQSAALFTQQNSQIMHADSGGR